MEQERQRGGGDLRDVLRPSPGGRRAGLRGGLFTGICVLVAALLVGVGGVDGVTTCQSVEYTHASDSACASARPFKVQRCAESAQALQTYMQDQKLEEKLTPDGCKQMWLRGCAHFYQLSDRFVVVPKHITCNKEVCDQSSMYSNCVEDAHCAGINSVAEGLPAPNAVWPFSGDPTKMAMDDGILPQYRPCCHFFERYCNGASCLGRDGPNTCPLQIAREMDRCTDDDCWHAGGAGRAAGPVLLLAMASSLVSLVAAWR